MPYFDRFDIAQAYVLYHYGYSAGGYATGRRETREGESNSDIAMRLSRMGYEPSPLFDWTYRGLDTDNAREIWRRLTWRKRWEYLTMPESMKRRIR